MKKPIFFVLTSILITFILLLSGCGGTESLVPPSSSGGNQTTEQPDTVPVYSENEITITAGDAVLHATMYDNRTAKNFLETLPFTLPTIERSGLAKGVNLINPIEYESERLTRQYKLGEIGYWPGGDIAIFYTDDLFDRTIVDVVQIGQIESGVEVFRKYSGSVTIERVKIERQIYDVSTSELYVGIGEQNIYGIVYTPVGTDGNLPAVVFSHGFGGSYATNISYAQEVAKCGYFTYVFDFRGGSYGSRSSGTPLGMTVFTEVDDLKAVVEAVASLNEVDENRIYLFGTSQGGMVSAITAADIPQKIKGAILLYPAFSIVEDINSIYSSKDEIPESRYYLWMMVGKEYFSSLLEYDVYAQIAEYTDDVLILHGDSDGIVPLSASQKAVESYSAATLYVLEGAGHGFSGENFNLALEYTLNYLLTH